MNLRERAEKIQQSLNVKADLKGRWGREYANRIESALREVRREALEEAAKEVESDTDQLSCVLHCEGFDLADKIRALSEKGMKG